MKRILPLRSTAFALLAAATALAQTPPAPAAKPAAAGDAQSKAEHAAIGVAEDHSKKSAHTGHPDAQWYPDAALGLFIHWGIASVRSSNISWPMIPGRALAQKRITDPAERERIIREGDYNLNGKPNAITPNEYWSAAPKFNPQNYDPDKWMAAAKDAGFTYVVLTTRHHEGFALWPSDSGDFSTKNWMGGRDLLRAYVDACRKYGLKVGFYYSPPDWHFDRDYMNFMYGGGAKNNPEFPPLDADLKPRATTHTAEEIAAHRAAYARHVRTQVEELLTRYGKIDLLWFDGRPGGLTGDECITLERIRELQPGIVVNPRLHGRGDFVTFERRLPATRPDLGWAEFCNTWTTTWSHAEIPFRAPGFILGQLAQSRAWGINYLPGVGPKADGSFTQGIYDNMAIVAGWMKQHRDSIFGATPLPAGETSSNYATARGGFRYLFAIPTFSPADQPYPEKQLPAKDETLTLKGTVKPKAVTLLGSGQPLDFTFADGVTTVQLPAALRTKLVDVVRVDLGG